jgi:hypothetical protein
MDESKKMLSAKTLREMEAGRRALEPYQGGQLLAEARDAEMHPSEPVPPEAPVSSEGPPEAPSVFIPAPKKK